MKLRPALKWFADQMETQLCENDHKGGWSNDGAQLLLARLMQEVSEVVVELDRCSEEEVIKECADVANFAMMIADNVRGVEKNV